MQMFKIIKKYLLIICGTISLTLGIVGIFLPLLPTTPLVLLAALCYIRSSKRLYDWIINHKVFGNYIYNYITYKTVKKSIKVKAILFLWMSLLISMILIDELSVTIILSFIGFGVSLHLATLKS